MHTLTGFLSAVLFAVSMILALRLVFFDRIFGGLGRLFVWHHRMGVLALLFMLLHPLLLGIRALQLTPELALDLLWPNPASVVVFTGWVSLIGFVVFFVATVSKNLSYRVWRHIHRASAIAYLAMVAHIWVVGSGSVLSYMVLGLLALGLFAFGYRVLGQDVARGGLKYRVIEVKARDEDVLDLVLEPLGPGLSYDVGQFAYLAISDTDDHSGCGELHPYTMTGVPGETNLRFSIKALGPCTRHLQAVKQGSAARVKGAYGALFPEHTRTSPQVWIGGGVGITPFVAAMRAKKHTGRVDLFYAAKSQKAARFLADLEELTQGLPDAGIHTIFEDVDGRPNVESIFERIGGDRGQHFVLAGPTQMVENLRDGLIAQGVKRSNIHSELGVLR